MAKQISGVILNDLGEGLVNVQIGPLGYQVQSEQLFSLYHDEQVIKENLRLCKLISGFKIGSFEFLGSMNKGGNGAEGRNGRYFIKSVVLTDANSQQYTVAFGKKSGEVQFTITIAVEELAIDPENPETILLNLPAWLRIEGIMSVAGMTQAQKDKLKNYNFWI